MGTGAKGAGLAGLPGCLANAVLAAEFVDATARIDDLLLARIKRMTGRADLDHEVFAERRTRREFVAATAGNLDIRVVGMGIGFHG
jgi:hypothetical protein